MNAPAHKLYDLLGIGGIGMSALARYFRHFGAEVRGYDKTETGLTRDLVAEGIPVHYHDDVAGVKQVLARYEKSEVLVVHTPAVPADHAELVYFRENGYELMKRAAVLGAITQAFKTIAIAGTHGKTTTTAMVAHLLKNGGENCFAFIGGLSANYGTNLLLGDTSRDAWMVVEADEFDRSFLTLEPLYAVITSADADHLDVYGDASHVRESYSLFAARVRENGLLVVKKTVDNELILTNKRQIYSLNLDTDYRADRISIENGAYHYDVTGPVTTVRDIELGVAGRHNVENSVAAAAIALQVGLSPDAIREGLRSFRGVKRRFEFRVRKQEIVYIDDYAHHPVELQATIRSAKELFPGKKITGIFQPHLFSRTRDFADEFAKSLDLLDDCILLEIYPAREKPIPGVSSNMLLDRMQLPKKRVVSRDGLPEVLRSERMEVVLTMGAGDIDRLTDQIQHILENK